MVTHLLYSPVGFDLKQVQRARKSALKLVAEATELSPGLDHFRESFRALFASFGSSSTGLYSKRVLYSKGVNPSSNWNPGYHEQYVPDPGIPHIHSKAFLVLSFVHILNLWFLKIQLQVPETLRWQSESKSSSCKRSSMDNHVSVSWSWAELRSFSLHSRFSCAFALQLLDSTMSNETASRSNRSQCLFSFPRIPWKRNPKSDQSEWKSKSQAMVTLASLEVGTDRTYHDA